ncbi:DUF3945 domain-containing protein [Adhaeribacter rhizoryzae]|uniref:DUF3945 domain-containing protein n=1 Tax=Adhaeribacter rhizoryzae TaxID=2607907 RepID=A0A5M6D3D4_9BACT|nr:DUF3945 domain-containing protein [Adhaeribacter rhizoryzae]KAA5541984.1 DUF3945 domain-containing protein [Adhaeribacter rhizoryzae]
MAALIPPPVSAGDSLPEEPTATISSEVKLAAEQKKQAFAMAQKLFPENKFSVISIEPDISGGYNFQLKTQKEDHNYPHLKPGFKQPREIEREIEKLNTFKISFDHHQEKAKINFDTLGTLKTFSYKELKFNQGNKSDEDLTQSTHFNYQGYHIERSYQTQEKGAYRITDRSGNEIGKGEAGFGPEGPVIRASDGRQMPYFKTDAEIKKEVDGILSQLKANLTNDPQHLFTVNKENGEISIIGKNEEGKPVLRNPENLKNLTPGESPPLLELIPHKGFLGNFILNFRNNYTRNNLEFLAVPQFKSIEKALGEIKEHLPGLKAGLISTLESLKEKTGISGITVQTEREFVHLPEEQQQKLLGSLANDTQENNAYTINKKNGRWEMPEEDLPKNSFQTDLKDLLDLFKDEESALPENNQHTHTQIHRPIKDSYKMQGPKFNPDNINWKDAEKLGLTKELLEKTDNMKRLLNGEKTTLFQGLKGDLGGVKVSIDGKFRLVESPSGQPTFVFHGVRSELDIPKNYLGYQFTEEDKQNLRGAGNLNKQVTLTDKATNSEFKAYVGVDKDTNELVAIRAERIKIPSTLKGVILTEEQKKILEAGKPIALAGMKDDKNQEFSATVQIDPAKKGFSFRPMRDPAIKEMFKPENKIRVAADNDSNKVDKAKPIVNLKNPPAKEADANVPRKKRGGPKL